MPPKKGNGLIAGGVGFLLVVVFVITGFFAPGFLVPDDRPASRGTDGPPLDLDSGSVVAGKFILAVLGDDATGARQAACASAEGVVASAVRTLGSRNAQLSAGAPSRAGADEIRVPLTGTIGREPVQGELRVQRIQQTYCISGITVPS
jgi:peptidyl-prolyl cis-trans isomerase B (cyclophilin B)